MSRREFLTKSTLAVAGAAVAIAGCGDGQIGGGGITSLPSGSTGPVTLKVSTIPGLANTGQLVLLPNNDRVAVKRTGASTFVALSRVCTHEGTIIDLTSNNSFECPNHGARYDADGNVTRQPQAAGSATTLPRYTATYDAATDILSISAPSSTGTGRDDSRARA